MYTEMTIREFDKAFPSFLDSKLPPDILFDVRQDPRYLVRFGPNYDGQVMVEFGYREDTWQMFK